MSEENKNLNNTSAPEGSSAKAEAKAVKTTSNTAKKPAKKVAKSGGVKAFFKSRKARHGTVAIAIVAVVIAIVIVLNIVCNLLVGRFPSLKLDMTSSGSYALQEDTVDYVSHLSKDVTINVTMTRDNFEAGGSYLVQAATLMDKMVSDSDGKLTVKYIDLTTNPNFTAPYKDVDWTDSSQNYMMVVECGEQYKVLKFDDCFEYDQESYYYHGYEN